MEERSEHDPEIRNIVEQINLVAPTDAAAMEVFYQYSLVYGRKKCDHDQNKVTRSKGGRKSSCDECGLISWFTSGTLLNRAKRFRAYLIAFSIREAGLIISAFAFSRLADIHYGTAFNIHRKLNVAMANQMSTESVEISARPLATIIARRSRETPARMHPFAEQEEIEQMTANLESQGAAPENQSGSENNQTNPGSDGQDSPLPEDVVQAAMHGDFNSAISVIFNSLSSTGISTDNLAMQTSISIGLVCSALTMLEIDGKAKQLPDGGFVRVARSTLKSVLSDDDLALAARIELATQIVMQIVEEFFCRVSRKFIQLYLAAIWCALDRERWGKDSVLELCFNHPPVTYKKMVNYVSPPLLKIALCS